MTEQALFVVMERGFEYNDEGYDQQEGGNTQIAYLTEAQADQEALRRTKIKLQGGSVGEYMEYDWQSKLCSGGLLGHIDDRDDLDQALQGLSDDDLTYLAKEVGDRFFYVEETTLG